MEQERKPRFGKQQKRIIDALLRGDVILRTFQDGAVHYSLGYGDEINQGSVERLISRGVLVEKGDGFSFGASQSLHLDASKVVTTAAA